MKLILFRTNYTFYEIIEFSGLNSVQEGKNLTNLDDSTTCFTLQRFCEPALRSNLSRDAKHLPCLDYILQIGLG